MTEFGRKRKQFRRKPGPKSMVRRPRRFRRQNVRTGGFMGIEKKFADNETNNDAFSSTWATMEDATNSQISGVAQGNGESQRIGRKITILSIHIRMRVHVAASESVAAPLPDLFGRVVIVLDKQTNAAQLTATDVMDAGQTDDVLAYRNLQQTERFQVLWDKKWFLPAKQSNEGAVNLFAQGAQSTPMMFFNKTFPNGGIRVTYNGTATGVVAAVTDNSIHCIGIANLASALLNMQIRIRYTG